MQGPDTDSLVRVSDVEEKDDLADVSVDWGNDRKELAPYCIEPGLCPGLFTSPSLSLCLTISQGSGLWLTFFKLNIFNNSDWTFLFLKLSGNLKLFKVRFSSFCLPASKHHRRYERVDRGQVEDEGGREGAQAEPGQHLGAPAGGHQGQGGQVHRRRPALLPHQQLPGIRDPVTDTARRPGLTPSWREVTSEVRAGAGLETALPVSLWAVMSLAVDPGVDQGGEQQGEDEDGGQDGDGGHTVPGVRPAWPRPEARVWWLEPGDRCAGEEASCPRHENTNITPETGMCSNLIS